MTTDKGQAVPSSVPHVSATRRTALGKAGPLTRIGAMLRGGAGAPPLFACAVLGLLACEDPAANAPTCGTAFGALGYKDGEAGLPKRDLQAAAAACSAAGQPAPDIALYETRYRAGHYVARAGRGFSAAPRVSIAQPAPAAAAPQAPAPAPAATAVAPAAAAPAQTAAKPADPLAQEVLRALEAPVKPAPVAAAAAAPATVVIDKPAAPGSVPNRAPRATYDNTPVAAKPAAPAAAPAPSAPIVAAPQAPQPVDRALATEPPRAPSAGEAALIKSSKPAVGALPSPQAPAVVAQGPCGGKPCPEAVVASPQQPPRKATQVFQSDSDLSRVPDSVLKPSLSAAERRLLGLQ